MMRVVDWNEPKNGDPTVGAGLRRAIEAEQDRWFLWLPVLFGAGIAGYFALPIEPPGTLAALAALMAVALRAFWRNGVVSIVVGGALASGLLGLAVAKLASDLAAGPVLERSLRTVAVTGWVELVEPQARGGRRITVRTASIEGIAGDLTPRRVRVRLPDAEPPLGPGDPISVRASLLPPSGPALPGAYDFARAAWFSGLGGVGSARGRPERIDIALPMPLTLRLWIPVERLRQQISRRITAAIPGETGAIAAALITGERGGITEATNQAYRDSGIFHILSISGLHMTIFAGAVYFTARFVLSLFPILALSFEIKKWAAVAGLLGTGGYLLISGGSPPAVRSAVMLAIVFFAILLDRPALALRNVALAALVILVATPSSLIDVGFQMSFAAVVALISGVEAWQQWRQRHRPAERNRRGVAATGFAFLATITLTTLIATASVAPLAAYYFHKSTQYGVLANLAAVPVCNLLVMPAALAALLAMPLGLEAWPLSLMAFGIDAMTWVAVRVAGLPGAVTLLPAIPTVAFALMVGGGLWLCLWAERWRRLGLVAVAIGLVMAPLRQPPDIMVGAGGDLVALRGPDGRLAVLDAGRSGFELGRWLEHDADSRPAETVGSGGQIRCDAVGCSGQTQGLRVAIARHPAALADDCRTAGLIIWLGEGRPQCQDAIVALITREAVVRDGTHVVRVSPAGGSAVRDGRPRREPLQLPRLSIETVAAWRGDRPWSSRRTPAPGAGDP